MIQPHVLTLVTEPTEEPVSVAEAKIHLRITNSAEDTSIGSLITASRQVAENATRRVFVTQTWEGRLDRFPRYDKGFEVPKPPLRSVSKIEYVDDDGVTQTLPSSDYQVDVHSLQGRVAPAFDKSWPTTRDDTLNAVIVTFEAGYGAAAAVPQAIKQAMLLHIGTLYEHREDTVIGLNAVPLPLAASRLLSPYIVETI